MDAAWLKAERQAACDTLTAAGIDGLAVESSNPEFLVPPAAVFFWGSPLLEGGDTFGGVKLRFTFQLSVPAGANDRVTDDLDALISSAAAVFWEGGYTVEQVGLPYMLETQQAKYLTADMQLSYETTP